MTGRKRCREGSHAASRENYAFKKRLLKAHQENLRDHTAVAQADELTLPDCVAILLPESQIANAELAIPLVEADPRLGWEASMEYMTDRPRIEWKLRLLRFVLESELAAYKRASLV